MTCQCLQYHITSESYYSLMVQFTKITKNIFASLVQFVLFHMGNLPCSMAKKKRTQQSRCCIVCKLENAQFEWPVPLLGYSPSSQAVNSIQTKPMLCNHRRSAVLTNASPYKNIIKCKEV